MKRIFLWLKKYFIPHRENAYKPHFLRHESMLFFFLLIIIVELGFLIQVFIIFDKTGFLASVLPGVLTSLTNEEREENNAAPLLENELLALAAKLKAEDMAREGYFAHTSPDGKTPWYWLNQVGYKYALAGENLAVNFFESDEVAQAWMDSPTHRANIVKKDYTEIGIGVATGKYEGKNTVFVAQFFGTPIKTIAVVQTPAPPVSPLQTPTTPPASTPTPSSPTPIETPPESPGIAIAPVETQVLGEEVNKPIGAQKSTSMISSLSSLRLFVEKVLTSPRQYVTYIYGGIALLVLLALLFVIFIRSEMAHPFLIARGVGLVAVIIFLLFVNIKVLTIETELPPGGISASVIASQ